MSACVIVYCLPLWDIEGKKEKKWFPCWHKHSFLVFIYHTSFPGRHFLILLNTWNGNSTLFANVWCNILFLITWNCSYCLERSCLDILLNHLFFFSFLFLHRNKSQKRNKPCIWMHDKIYAVYKIIALYYSENFRWSLPGKRISLLLQSTPAWWLILNLIKQYAQLQLEF